MSKKQLRLKSRGFDPFLSQKLRALLDSFKNSHTWVYGRKVKSREEQSSCQLKKTPTHLRVGAFGTEIWPRNAIYADEQPAPSQQPWKAKRANRALEQS